MLLLIYNCLVLCCGLFTHSLTCETDEECVSHECSNFQQHNHSYSCSHILLLFDSILFFGNSDLSLLLPRLLHSSRVFSSALPMASCSLGPPKNTFLSLHFGGKRAGILQHFGTRSWISRKPMQYTSLVMPQKSTRFSTASTSPSLEIQSIRKSEDASVEIKSSGVTSGLIPNFHEVEFLLMQLSDSSSIREIDLKLAGFHLHVVRGLNDKVNPLPPPVPDSPTVKTVTEAPNSNGSASTSLSLAISRPLLSPGSVQRFIDQAADEGLVLIPSPKVGFFRRSRTIKGKRAPPACKENQNVEEGKVICYIEQLGGQLPIESDVTGEVIKILREDGEPVGYGDALIAILPSFPGIKKLQ